ncbi:fibrinogen-like protein A [Dysidea avara]|uniref:fibrinogen-like protein A n=1 Tax=Dysidea avara TaxID=196820 RepID=UPI00333161B8
MKSQLQLVILLILVSSLQAVNADQQCDYLLQQCNQLKAKCRPETTTIKSCCDLTNFPLSKAPSAVYQMKCKCGGRFTTADVYCDMDTSDGGWIVIQRNIKDDVNTFNKTWEEYEEGFGSLTRTKLWYGLQALHCFTQTGHWELRIDFQFDNHTWSHLHYNTFSVGSARQEYPLTIGGFTGTTTTDPAVTVPINGRNFSTYDNDNDGKSDGSCASSVGGWWYDHCSHLHPNRQPPRLYLNSKDHYLRVMEMKIRPHNCITQ